LQQNSGLQSRSISLPEYLRPSELAQRLQISPKTLALWRQQGIGPEWNRLGPRLVYYPVQSLTIWIASQGQASTSQAA